MSTPYYGKSHVLHGVSMEVNAGEIVSPAGPQRLRPLDHRQGHHGPGRRQGLGAVKGGQELLGRKAYEIAHMGMGYVPENRDIFPKLTVHQNLLLGKKDQEQEQRAGASRTCTACSRA